MKYRKLKSGVVLATCENESDGNLLYKKLGAPKSGFVQSSRSQGRSASTVTSIAIQKGF